MTKFFTIMWITFNVPNHGEMQSALLYPSQQACGFANDPPKHRPTRIFAFWLVEASVIVGGMI